MISRWFLPLACATLIPVSVAGGAVSPGPRPAFAIYGLPGTRANVKTVVRNTLAKTIPYYTRLTGVKLKRPVRVLILPNKWLFAMTAASMSRSLALGTLARSAAGTSRGTILINQEVVLKTGDHRTLPYFTAQELAHVYLQQEGAGGHLYVWLLKAHMVNLAYKALANLGLIDEDGMRRRFLALVKGGRCPSLMEMATPKGYIRVCGRYDSKILYAFFYLAGDLLSRKCSQYNIFSYYDRVTYEVYTSIFKSKDQAHEEFFKRIFGFNPGMLEKELHANITNS
ncbi:MAG: hypothetical protein ACM3X6_11500 [Patescibacteria group bacterium]